MTPEQEAEIRARSGRDRLSTDTEWGTATQAEEDRAALLCALDETRAERDRLRIERDEARTEVARAAEVLEAWDHGKGGDLPWRVRWLFSCKIGSDKRLDAAGLGNANVGECAEFARRLAKAEAEVARVRGLAEGWRHEHQYHRVATPQTAHEWRCTGIGEALDRCAREVLNVQ